MKKLIILGLLTISGLVWGQSNPQKECYKEAHKQWTPGQDGTSVWNHYDSATQICWARTQQQWKTSDGEYRMFDAIGNVYEPTISKAMFLGPRFDDVKSLDTCFVDKIKCHNIEEWYDLAKKYYPDLF